jgi:hypothetical protein
VLEPLASTTTTLRDHINNIFMLQQLLSMPGVDLLPAELSCFLFCLTFGLFKRTIGRGLLIRVPGVLVDLILQIVGSSLPDALQQLTTNGVQAFHPL